MQLLNLWTLNIIVTAFVVTSIVSFLSALAGWGWPNTSKRFLLFFVSLFAFAILGFVTGLLMGDSRESAVGAVVPAILTLFGALGAYIVGSKGIRERTLVSVVMICFAFSLLIGTIFGIEVRIEVEHNIADPDYLRQRELVLEQNKLAVESRRLQDYIEFLRLKNEFAEKNNLDLSKFDSAFEKHDTETKAGTAVKSEATGSQSSTAQKK